MKILDINIYFILDEDFKGDLPEALECAAKYLRSKNKKSFAYDGVQMDPTWENFLKAREQGFRLHGVYGINEWIDNKWEKLD